MTRHSTLRRLTLIATGAMVTVIVAVPNVSLAQTSTRTTIVTQSLAYGPAGGFGSRHFHSGTRLVTRTTLSQTIVSRAPAPLPGDVVPFALLPTVSGIRQTPVAPPTVYRIAGPRTAMHEADERRMHQINPGARVISPDDVDLSRETRRRYGVRDPGQMRAHAGPRVIVILPE
jgi:hypothetical protein